MPKEYPRKLRLNVQLQRELTELIRDELTDPRLKGVTITRVDVSPDLRQARVFVSQLAIDARPEEAVAALAQAAGRLHQGLGRRLRLRYIPHLHFVPDRGLLEGDRISSLIRKVVREDAEHARERDEDEKQP